MALLQFDCKKGGGKTDVVQSAGSAISGAVRLTVDPTAAGRKRHALFAIDVLRQAIIQALWQGGTPSGPVDTPGFAVSSDSEGVFGHATIISLNTGTWTISRDTNGLITLAKTNHGILGDCSCWLQNMTDSTLSVMGQGHYVDANTYTIQTAVTGLPLTASTTAYQQPTNSGVVRQSMFSMRGWAQIQSAFKGGLKFQGTYGQFGILASAAQDQTIKAALAAQNYVLIILGINDAKSGGQTSATVAASVLARVADVTSRGKKAIVVSVPPMGTAYAGTPNAATINATIVGSPSTPGLANNLIAAGCNGVNAIYLNLYDAMLDVAGTSNSGQPGFAYSYSTISDGLHWTAWTWAQLAQLFFAAINPSIVVHDLLPRSSSAVSVVPYATLIRNRGVWAVVGANAGSLFTGATGILPAGWGGQRSAGTGAVVYSSVDPGDGKGVYVTATITSGGATDVFITYPENNSGVLVATGANWVGGNPLAVGTRLLMAIEVSWSNWNASNASRLRFNVTSNGSGAFANSQAGSDSNNSESAASWIGDTGTMTLVTGVMVTPAGLVGFVPQVEVDFSAASGSPLVLNMRCAVYDSVTADVT